MVSAFVQKLLNKEQTPTLKGGITYGADDLIADNSLTNSEKQQILQNNLILENKRLDDELRNYKAKQYLGAALQIGSAAIPIGAGARLGAGITKTLAPRVGRKIAQEIGTGLASGTVSGAVEGFGRGLVEDVNPFQTMAQDSLIGGSTGGLGGYGLGRLAQRFDRGIIQNNPIAQKQYFDNYIADLSNKTNAMADFRAAKMGYNGSRKQLAYDLANINDDYFNANFDNKTKSNWAGITKKGNTKKSKSRYYPQNYRGEEFNIRISDHNKALKGSGQWSDDSYTVFDFNGTPIKFDNDFLDGYSLDADVVVNKIGDFNKNKKDITKFINNKVTETYKKWNMENPNLYK